MTENHEGAVAAFLAKAKADDPERFAVVCSKYPVLTRRQVEYRQQWETCFSQFDRNSRRLLAYIFGDSEPSDGIVDGQGNGRNRGLRHL